MDGDMDGGASEFAGGGFMPAPSTPGGGGPGMGGAGSTFSPSAGGRRSGSTVLYPFTIRHLHTTYVKDGGDALTLNAQDINNVILVGRVVNMEQRTTDLTFLLDDGTGKVEVRKWHDDTEQERETLNSVKVGTHVKVHGVPRKLGSKQTVSANSVRPITDFNEYTCHFLDCIFAYQYSRGPHGSAQQPGTGAPSPQRPGPNPGHHTQGSYQVPQAGAYGGVHTTAPSQGINVQLHDRVLKYFQENEHVAQEGLHRDAVARSIPGASPAAVIEAIDFLANEGLVYSTIDDLHFKSIDQQ